MAAGLVITRRVGQAVRIGGDVLTVQDVTARTVTVEVRGVVFVLKIGGSAYVDQVQLQLIGVSGHSVRVRIDAPPDVPILRDELTGGGRG